MEVRFSVDVDAGDSTNFVLHSPGDVTIGQLLPPLLHHVGVSSPIDEGWMIDGQALDPNQTLAGSSLRDGSRLSRKRIADQLATEGYFFELAVISGPSAGERHLLAPGTWVIGRSSECDVALGDEEVSRRHARLILSFSGVVVEDLGSSNGTYVDDQRAVGAVTVPATATLELGQSQFVITPPAQVLSAGSTAGSPEVEITPQSDGGLAYNRPPRLISPTSSVIVSFPDQPKDPRRANFAVASMVAPLLLGCVMAFALHQIAYLAFTAATPLMAGINYLTQRRQGTKGRRAAAKAFREGTARAQQDVQAALDIEKVERAREAPGPSDIAAIAAVPLDRLWERRRTDPDYLQLRIGTARLPSRVSQVGHAEPLFVDAAPLTFNLSEIGVVGIAAPRRIAQDLGAFLVGQIAVLHSPRAIEIIVLTDVDQKDRWEWIQWLPHARGDGRTCVSLLGNDVDTCARLLARLSKDVDERSKQPTSVGRYATRRTEREIVLLLDGARTLRDLPGATHVLREGQSAGVFAICLDDAPKLLPEECRGIVVGDIVSVMGTPLPAMTPLPTTTVDPHDRASAAVQSGLSLRVQLPDGSDYQGVAPDHTPDNWARRIARSLAPIRDVSREDGASALPSSLRLLDLLGLEPPVPEQILARWRSGRTTAAPIGATVEGPFTLDLARDGPHGLIAGTTGAGKSELLQSLIASLAALNSPESMGFVLVDYKGGSAFKDCARLPHTLGMVTDLDSHLTERALASLGAELRRRKLVLDRVGCKDIEDYFEALDAGRVAAGDRIGRVLIVIDEFASLVEELPDFVGGLVGIARQGRSLGVHLLLATQRPGGVVSPEIRANANLRVALRVTNPAESTDVIDVPEAARISESTPGRGFARLGHDRLVSFQAARVGGARSAGSRLDDLPKVAKIEWRDLGRPIRFETMGLEPTMYQEAAVTRSGGFATDLSLLADAIGKAAEEFDLAGTTTPWLEPLPEELVLEEIALPDLTAGEQVLPLVFALEDLPNEQRQSSVALDLENGGHLLAAGSARSGRTTLLRTIAGSLGRVASPADVHLYVIDCGNGGLASLVGLPHCGAVVTRTETERVDRLLQRLSAEVVRRQQILAAGGFANIAEQRRATSSPDRLPFQILMIDRWEGFTGAFEDLDGGRLISQLMSLLREAPATGLRVVMTGDRSALLGRLSTFIEDRIVLRFNDRNDYGAAGLNPRRLPDVIPAGRAYRADTASEMQVALLDRDVSGAAQNEALETICREARQAALQVSPDALPEQLAVLPNRVTWDEILPQLRSDAPLWTVVGVGGNQGLPVGVDLTIDGPAFVIAGPPRSGRSTALGVVAKSMARNGTRLLVVSPRATGVPDLVGSLPETTLLSGQDLDPAVVSAASQDDRPLAILLDDAELVEDGPFGDALITFLKGARDRSHCLVVAGNGEDMKNRLRGFLAEVRKSRSGLILNPQSPLDGEVLGSRLPKTATLGGPQGRAVLSLGGRVVVVQAPALR